MVSSHGNIYDQVITEIRNTFIKNQLYKHDQIKDILSRVYNKYDVDREPKITDLDEILRYKQKRINNKRYIQIL